MATKLNLGCGNEYKEGWINIDVNKKVKADIYHDLTKRFPFKDGYIDEILLDNVLEHIKKDYYFKFLKEIHRICKKGAKIHIYVPHFSGMYAFTHPTHYNYFGVGSFDIWKPEDTATGERYGDDKVRFDVKEEKLLFFHHNLTNFKFLSKLPINWIFNFGGRNYQQLWQKFYIWGFDEIYYQLEVIK